MSASALLALLGEEVPPEGTIALVGRDPILPTPLRVGEAAAAALAAGAWSAARMGERRGGRPQRVRVDVRAAAASLLGFLYQSLEGAAPVREARPTIGLYPTRDGGWLHLHGGFPHLARGTLDLLGCADEEAAIARAVARWDGRALEDALAAAGQCGALVRTPAEWREHAQGRALAALPPVIVEKIGDAPPEPLPPAARPLAGVRVLDLTRVLAGPACGRTLALHGADVMRISSPRLPSIPPFVMDTSHGKLSAWLDLDVAGEREQLGALVERADVFAQGYRQGALARRGFGPQELVHRRPGLVYASMNCYGPEGPWCGRPGWEQLAQCATGLAVLQGSREQPRLVPAAACDYTTGYLAALGVSVALARRAREGGSWHVQASLCQTALWLQSLGASCDPDAARGVGDPSDLLCERSTPFGRLRYLAPPVAMTETPPRWERPTAPLGSHPPRWPERPQA